MGESIFDISGFMGVFSKSFGHTGPSGIPMYPDQEAYRFFVDGIRYKIKSNIDFICGGTGYTGGNTSNLVDPYCLFDNENYGVFKSTVNLPPAPSPSSEQTGAEMIELYAMGLLRDAPLIIFDPEPSYYNNTAPNGQTYIDNIVNELNQPEIKNYLGAPLYLGDISYNVLFRGNTTGDLMGPYISQFFYYGIIFGQSSYYQKYYTCIDPSFVTFYDVSSGGQKFYENSSFWNMYTANPFNIDYIKTQSSFSSCWNGGPPESVSGELYVRSLTSLRDCALYINNVPIWVPYLNAVMIFLTLKVPMPLGFRFFTRTGGKFINLGQNDLCDLLLEVEKMSINACWLWKWSQMRIRPEELANQVNLNKNYGMGIDLSLNLLNNPLLVDVSNLNVGNYFLPQAYTTGCNTHPSYPSAHATVASAMSTVLKAWFNCDSSMNAYQAGIQPFTTVSLYGIEKYPFANPLFGSQILLNIGNELDKMASNIGMFSCFAGVHFRSDVSAGWYLGEEIAIQVLSNWVKKYSDDIIFKFRKRNGDIWEIRKDYSGISSAPVYYTTPITIDVDFNVNNFPATSPGEEFLYPNLS